MTLTIEFEVPSEVEAVFRSRGEALAREMKEAYVVELFRQGKLSHFGLSKALGLDRLETDAYLKRRGIFEGALTEQDIDDDLTRLREGLAKEKR